MDANYLYDVFGVEAQDLTIALAMHQHDHPIPEGTTEREIREFIGRHYNALVDAYKAQDRDAFSAVVAQCEAEDAERLAAQEETQEG